MLCRGLALPLASERHMYITQSKITVTRQLEICQRRYQQLQCCCTLAGFTNATASVAASVASWSQHGAGLRRGIPVTVFLAAQTGDRVYLSTPPLAGPSPAESFPKISVGGTPLFNKTKKWTGRPPLEGPWRRFFLFFREGGGGNSVSPP